MSLTRFGYVSQRPGLERAGRATDTLYVSPEEGAIGFLPSNHLGAMTGWHGMFAFGGHIPYVVAEQTETKDNSSTIAKGAAGYVFQVQASPSDNDDVCINSVATKAVAANKIWKAALVVKVSSAANFGLKFGFVTSGGTEIFTANPTDGVFFSKAKNAATVVGSVVENGNAAVSTGTILTMTDDTEVEIAVEFCIGSSAATSWGSWWVNGTETKFSAAQLTALYTLLATTAPTLAAHLGFRVNSTTQRSGTVRACLAGCHL